MLCAKTTRALRVVWKYYKPYIYILKGDTKESHCWHLYFWSCADINGVAKKRCGSERKARYSKNPCMVFLQASLMFFVFFVLYKSLMGVNWIKIFQLWFFLKNGCLNIVSIEYPFPLSVCAHQLLKKNIFLSRFKQQWNKCTDF